QKRKDEICPFSSLAFLQPTTVDKEPKKKGRNLSFLELSFFQPTTVDKEPKNPLFSKQRIL
ncbi:hypothetical protein RLB54_02045, partial [Streptococcus pneumoniae]|nr:hypothetical protein [Streptococcus pneumoniae]MDS5233930.1 hypothetical protein [Streptococcus pneumoniae]